MSKRQTVKAGRGRLERHFAKVVRTHVLHRAEPGNFQTRVRAGIARVGA